MTRNILTNFDETLSAMASIEDRSDSSYWLERQKSAADLLKDVNLTEDPYDVDKDLREKVQYTIGEALIECAGRSTKPDDWEQEAWDSMQEGISCIVYGMGGWNRWGVKYTGEVLFSKYHARQGDVELAKSSGFKVW